MSIFKTMVTQVSKPTGFLGKLIAIGMNYNHKRLTNWGLNGVNIGRDFIILDIGCGGGATIKRLSKVAIDGKVYGIDISDISVQASIKKNRNLIEKGKVEITKGSVSTLPFQDNFFDLITGINTHIFWPDIKNDMKEVLRTLKLNGILLTLADVYKNEKFTKRNKKITESVNINFHTKEELEKIYKESGFSKVEVSENYEKCWIRGFGVKIS